MITTNPIIEHYFGLIQNLNQRAKLELISRISNSMLDNNETKQEQLLSCFGAFISDQSADEMINSIYKDRHFTDKDIEL
jgi:oligoribonuclease (3'-5' exoribonuclease)